MRQYTSLYALDRSENRVIKSVRSYMWNTSVEDAEGTLSELFGFGLVTLAQTGAMSANREKKNGKRAFRTLALHDLQAEYSTHITDGRSHGIDTRRVHEAAKQGTFKGDVDFDLPVKDDRIRRR